MSIGKRIKEVRKALKLTQPELAAKLGLTQSAISGYEAELKNVSEPSIISICRAYNVNEQWLRTGEGDMFTPLTKNQEIANFLNDVMESKGEFKNDFILALSKLDDKKWEAIADFVNEIKK